MTLFYRFTHILILFICSSIIGYSQPLSGILPKHQGYEYSQTPSFSWNSLNGALDYTVVLAQDPAFTINLTQSPAITLTNWTASTLAFGTWYWKVQANTVAGMVSSPNYILTIYTPLQSGNLALWLKADAGLLLDGSSNVDTWTDLGPNGYTFNQTNAIKRPSINIGLNGFPALNFTGSQFLNGGDVLDMGTQSRSMFAVGKMAASNQTIFSKSVAALASHRYGLIKDATSTAYIYQGISSHHIYSTFNSLEYSLYSISTNRVTAKNRFEVNNVLLGQSTISGGNFDMNSTSRFLIGAYNNATNDGELLLLTGGISEMVFINTADSIEILNVENYLRHKYSPPINLSKDSIVNHFCTINLTAPVGFTNLLWSTGATTSSISINQSGLYWLQGTDVFGYISRDTILITYPTIPLPATTGICVNESIVWNADLGPGFSYLWSPNGETSPSISISTPGTYSVQVTDGLGCIRNSNLVNFTIDNYSQTAFLGNDTSLCVGNFIALQVGAAETVSYLWPDATTAVDYAVDTTGNYFVETINGNGCIARDTILITIAGQAPVANFSFQNACNGTINNFVDLSIPLPTDDIAIWSWDLGDGNTATAQNPSHVYVSPGTYDVELYVESLGGCGAFQTAQVVVYALPTAVIGNIGHCSGQEIQFSNSSTAGSGAITGYYWDFDMPWTGAYNNSAVTFPNRIFDIAGTYDVMMVVTDANACKDTVFQSVVVDQTPDADFSAANVCAGQLINFINTSNGGTSPTYLWDFGDATFSILATPSKSFASYGPKDILLSVSATNGCTDTAMRQVYVNPNPIISFTFGPHCFGSYMDMNSSSSIPEGSIAANMWIMNNSDTIYGDPAYFLIDLMGQNEIELTSTSLAGCTTSGLQFFDVIDTLIASFNVGSGIVAIGDPIQFNNTSIGAGILLWNFDDGTFSTEINPIHTYSGVFTDSILNPYLIAINAAGCKDTAYQTVQLANARIDLELQTIYTQANANSYTVGIKLYNAGTVNITTADLELWTERGLLFTETWNGLLLPGASEIYVFTGKPNVGVSSEDVSDAFICIEGIGYNSTFIAETYLLNNKSCKNIEGENVILLPLYPNPVSNAMTLEVIVSVETEFELILYDSRGRVIKNIVPKQTVSAGLYLFTVDVQDISNGTYFVRMINGENERMEKIVIAK